MASRSGYEVKLNEICQLRRHFRKYLLCQLLVVGFILYLWMQINGGLVPKFLRPRLPFLKIESDVHALIFFDVDNDASKVKWIREVNSKDALDAAMKSDAHMIEGDVILKGQGTAKQSLIPIMALPPSTTSDITLDDWLAALKYGSKGFKLDFSSVDSVEISLQKLKELNDVQPIRFPVWLHADVLQGPLGGKPKVDATRFFRHVKRLFPKCTLSLGWTTGTHTDLSRSGYTWDNVLDMYYLVKHWEVSDQPIVFQARLSLIHNSVTQLKWLCDNVPHAALMVWQAKEDIPIAEDLMYVAYRFPPESAFFDLEGDYLTGNLKQFRHFSQGHVNPLVLKRDEVRFKPKAWLKMGFYIEKDSILASTESLVLTTPIVYIVSKSKYKPTDEIYLEGRVQFLKRKNVESEPRKTGLNIYVRPTSYSNFDHIEGIRCFIGVDGDMIIDGSNLKNDNFKKSSQRFTPGSISCFRFRVINAQTKIMLQLNVLHECGTLDSVKKDEEVHAELTADVPATFGKGADHPFVLKLEDNKRTAVIEELSIKHT